MRSTALILGIAMTLASAAQEALLPLHEGWTFRKAGGGEWLPASVPGMVHDDLQRNRLIPDPMRNANADSVVWVENEDWEYRCGFRVDAAVLGREHVDLVFHGLDTYAEVMLNDTLLGRTDNMFRTWEWPVKRLLRAGQNELRVVFRSPVREGEKARNAYGFQLPHDSDPSGVAPYVRKAAYQFGWDFAPRLVTCGIWRPVELRVWDKGRLMNVKVDPLPETPTTMSSTVNVRVRTFTDVPDGTLIRKSYRIGEVNGGNEGPHQKYQRLTGEEVDATLFNVPMWEPGRKERAFVQPLIVDLAVEQRPASTMRVNVGVRTVELDQRPDDNGKPFRFIVNGTPRFMKGCNLVPPTSQPHAGNDSLWLARVRDIRRAGMNMVRVWAGGVYPPDVFFDACDTAGILVWQDLMFAYQPPGDEAGLERAMPEVNEQVARLWNHPSLALICGNNELDVAWKNWGWEKTYKLGSDQQRRAAKEYENLFDRRFRDAVEWGTLYTPTSPLSNWGKASGLKEGNLHYWGVWHADSAFSAYGRNVGRFMSEYGFQSYPDSATLATQLDPQHLVLGSPMLARRQRSYRTDKPIHEAIEREFAVRPRYLGEFILFSQLAQAEAYRQAIWAHVTGQPHCMGTLFWQLNDVWAGPSWSTVDHLGTWKAAMYEVKRAYAPLVLNLERSRNEVVVHLWNERTDLKHARVVTQVYRTDGTMALNDTTRMPMAFGSTVLTKIDLSAWLKGAGEDSTLVRVAVLDGTGAVAADRVLTMRRLGDMAWADPAVRMERLPGTSGERQYKLSTDRPVPVVVLRGKGLSFSDNYMTLLPGSPRTITVSGGAAEPSVEHWSH
jgi:beta-mannosidase